MKPRLKHSGSGGQTRQLERSCGNAHARSFACDRCAIKQSRREARKLSGALKRWMRQELNASWSWQPGCFDRFLRSDESLHDKWLYVQENPVRAGLVRHSKHWPYQIGLDDAL